MTVSLIVALARNRVIGDARGLPWHLPAELRRFKAITTGHPIVMGRTTHELIGRPLPGRENVVLTRDAAYSRPGVHVVHSPEEALAVARRFGDEVMVIGGAEVYRHFAPLAGRVYLTVVEGEFAGTVTFPLELLSSSRWTITHEERSPADERNPFAHRFYRLERSESGVDVTELIERAS